MQDPDSGVPHGGVFILDLGAVAEFAAWESAVGSDVMCEASKARESSHDTWLLGLAACGCLGKYPYLGIQVCRGSSIAQVGGSAVVQGRGPWRRVLAFAGRWQADLDGT